MWMDDMLPKYSHSFVASVCDMVLGFQCVCDTALCVRYTVLYYQCVRVPSGIR